MALPPSGAISFNNINVELGVAGTTQASLGQASYRTLAGVPSGQISMSNFYGKANQFSFTIGSPVTNANLRTLAVNAGWNQSSKVVATIGSGVYVSSDSTGTPAMTVSGSFPGGVELINSGFIVARGGNGGQAYGLSQPQTNGSPGGLALSVSSPISINNTGTIGGGGGGGGAGASIENTPLKEPTRFGGGGGGGGGRSSNAANSSGGAGGSYSTGGYFTVPGTAGGTGTVSAAGAGGPGGNNGGVSIGGPGGAGGGWGSSGSTGSASSGPGSNTNTAGGSGGGAVSGNSHITWISTGTRLGSIA